MSMFKLLLCMVGIHRPIIKRPVTLHALNHATCACGQVHWRWFQR